MEEGDRSNISNYRPIAILPNFSKIFEQILHARLSYCIKPFISTQQHGFYTGRSTLSNLAEVTQFICESLDRQHQVDVIYTDLAKAFDTVDHCILISKLSSLGFNTTITDLILSYLSNRSCYVCYNGFCSDVFTASSGVPQGPILDLYCLTYTSTIFCYH